MSLMVWRSCTSSWPNFLDDQSLHFQRNSLLLAWSKSVFTDWIDTNNLHYTPLTCPDRRNWVEPLFNIINHYGIPYRYVCSVITAQSSTKGFCLLNLLVAGMGLAWVMAILSSEMFEQAATGSFHGPHQAAWSNALVPRSTFCVQRDIKSVFVITLLYEVKKEVSFMGKKKNPWKCAQRLDWHLDNSAF